MPTDFCNIKQRNNISKKIEKMQKLIHKFIATVKFTKDFLCFSFGIASPSSVVVTVLKWAVGQTDNLSLLQQMFIIRLGSNSDRALSSISSWTKVTCCLPICVHTFSVSPSASRSPPGFHSFSVRSLQNENSNPPRDSLRVGLRQHVRSTTGVASTGTTR